MPLILILFLVFLSIQNPNNGILNAGNAGLDISTETIENISSNILFLDEDDPTARILVQKLIINNPLPITKKITLPVARICLYDKDGLDAMRDLDFEYRNIENESQTDLNLITEISPQTKKEIKLSIVPIPKSAFDTDLRPYTDYDEVLLLGPEKSCRVLDISKVNNINHIFILK